MKTIIAGSRDLLDPQITYDAIEQSGWKHLITEVVSGMAAGPDLIGRQWAIDNGIDYSDHPAAWRVNGVFNRNAGFERNQTMADYSDALIAVWDGKSGGTEDMIKRAEKAKLRIFVHNLLKPDLTFRFI